MASLTASDLLDMTVPGLIPGLTGWAEIVYATPTEFMLHTPSFFGPFDIGPSLRVYGSFNYASGFPPGSGYITGVEYYAFLGGHTISGIHLDLQTFYANTPQQNDALILAGDDTVIGSESTWGGSGDYLLGYAGNDLLRGMSGDDTLDGGDGADTLRGGEGGDTYVVDASDLVQELTGGGVDTIRTSMTYTLPAEVENLEITSDGFIHGAGNALHNMLTGGGGDNLLNGKAGDDTLVGGEGNDTLVGGGGTDVLDGGGGFDSMSGGPGDDIYIVDALEDAVIEAAGEGNDQVRSPITYALGSNLERLTLTGSDHIDGAGNGMANVITGNAGNNFLAGGGGNDTLSGGGGNDTLEGGAGDDAMAGGTGNDVYIVNALGDTITEFEWQGTDRAESTVTYTLAAHVEDLALIGAAGINGTGNLLDNEIAGNSASNVLAGAGGDDFLLGGGGADTLIGGGGNDTLDGGNGADSMAGGAGDDVYVVNAVTDVVTENAGAGIDTVQSSATYKLTVNVENLVLTGAGDINGTGNGLANAITGNSGANRLAGKGGADMLNGGGGNDILVYDEADVVMDGGPGVDTLRLEGSKFVLDLATIAGTVLKNLEVIDLTGTGDNALTLTLTDVLDISSTSDTLRIDGDAGDGVTATDTGSWVKGGDVVIGPNTYHSYTQGLATLLVDTDITNNLPA